MEESLQKLYDALSVDYDLGSFEEFRSKMQSPDSRSKLYNVVSKTHDLGSFEEFESKVTLEQASPVKKNESQNLGIEDGTEGVSQDAGAAEQSLPPLQSPEDISSLASQPVNFGEQAYKELKKTRGNDFIADAVDFYADEIEQARKQGMTPAEKQLADAPTPFEELTGKKNPFVPEEQATAREYKTIVSRITEENDKIKKAVGYLKSQMDEAEATGDMEKYDELNADFMKMKFVYEKNIERFQEDYKAGKFIDAMDFEEVLRERQKEADEAYESASIPGKIAKASGKVVLHTLAKASQSAARLTDVVEKSVGLEGETTGPVDKLQNLYIGLGDDIQNGFPAPTQLQRGGITETAQWGEYEVDFDGDEIQTIRKDGKVVNVSLSDEQIEEIKGLERGYQMNGASFAYQASSVIADVGVQILGAKGLGYATGLGPGFGLVAANAGMMANGLYEEGLENGLDQDNAARYALGVGTLVGVTALGLGAGAEERFLKLGLKAPTPNFGAGIGGAIGSKTFNFLKAGAGEAFEETVLEKLETAGVQVLMNETAGSRFDPDPYKSKIETINEIALSFAAGGLFHIVQKGKANSLMDQSALMEGSKDIDAAIEKTKEIAEIKEEPLTEKKENDLRQKLENTAAAIAKTPAEKSSTPEVVSLVAEKTSIDEEIKAAKDKMRETDEAFHGPLKEKVEKLEAQRDAMIERIGVRERADEILSQPVVAYDSNEQIAEESENEIQIAEAYLEEPKTVKQTVEEDVEIEEEVMEEVEETVYEEVETEEMVEGEVEGEPVKPEKLEEGKVYKSSIDGDEYKITAVKKNGNVDILKVPKPGSGMEKIVDVKPGDELRESLVERKTGMVPGKVKKKVPKKVKKQVPKKVKKTEKKQVEKRVDNPVKEKLKTRYKKVTGNELTDPVAKELAAIKSSPGTAQATHPAEPPGTGSPPPGTPTPATEGDRNMVKKRVATERAYEGDVREEVKAYLEEKGLMREVVSQRERHQQAKEFIGTFGIDHSIEAVKRGDLKGAVASSVLAQVAKIIDTQMSEMEASDPGLDALGKKMADVIDMMGYMAYMGGEYNSQLAYEYKNSDIGYNMDVVKARFKEEFGQDMPADMIERLKDAEEKIREAEKKIAEAEEKIREAEEKAAMANIRDAASRQGQKRTRPDIRQQAKDIAEKIRQGKTTRPDIFSMASPATLVWDAAIEIAARTVEAGGTIAEAIRNGVDHIRQSDWYQNLTRDDQRYAESQFSEYLTRSEPSTGRIPHSLLKELVASGIDDIKDLVDAVRMALPELNNMTDRQIRDAITNYGKVASMKQDEVNKNLRKLKRIGRIISQLEDIQQGKKPLRSGLQRDKPGPEERKLMKQLREALKELPVDAAAMEHEIKTVLDARKTRLENQIEDLTREIETGERVEKSKKVVLDSEEITRLKEKRDNLKEEWNKIFRDEAYMNEQRVKAAKRRTQNSIEDLKRRLREKDFAKKVHKPVVGDEELIKLRAEKVRLQGLFDKEFYKQKLRNRSLSEKLIDTFVWSTWNLPRIALATGEFSFVLIQGLVNTIAHPIHALKAMKNAVKFFASEAKTEQWLNETKGMPWYPEMKESRLAITEPHAELSAREELFYSDWSTLLWNVFTAPVLLFGKEAWKKADAKNPLKMFERAAVGYLDTLRVERFLQVRNNLREDGKTFDSHPEVYKDVADAINTLTGRASLGPLETIAPQLTKIFFSPRNWASQFKTATPYAFYYFGRLSPEARKMALMDFGKMVGFTTSMLMLAAAYFNNDDDDETGVEFDPRSADFMKIKLGKVRVDPWGGRIQQVVLTCRIIMDMIHDINPEWSEGGMKKANGKIYPLGRTMKTGDKRDVLMAAALNKLSPSASMLNYYLSKREDKKGNWQDPYFQPYDMKERMGLYHLDENVSVPIPIYWNTWMELADDDQGIDALDGLLLFSAFFGTGVSKYD